MRLLAKLPYDTIFTTVYAGLQLNLLLTIAGLPVIVAFALTKSPLLAWPFFAALSALGAPAVAAAFATFEDGQRFWVAYRARFFRSLGIGVAAAAAVIVLAADLQLAVGTPFGAAAPLLLLLIALIVVITVVLLAANSRLGWRLVLAVAYVSIRKWYLSLANLAVLAVLGAAVVVKPAVGLLLLPAPALYLVWANARHVNSWMERPAGATVEHRSR